MTRDEFEMIPENVKSGKMNWETAVRQMVVFVLNNKALFGLFKYDDDFISELIIEFLDRGKDAMGQYNRSTGAFFSYTFCFIKNLCSTICKKKAIKNVIDYHNLHESILNYENKVESYENIHYHDFERPKVPYKYTPISYKDFQVACKTDSYHIRKIINSEQTCLSEKIKELLKNYSPHMIQNIIMVLALKSAYYITENQIKEITTLLNIDYNQFHQIILKVKSEIVDRERNKNKMEIRRNKAYFLHKKLRAEIDYNKNCEESFYYDFYESSKLDEQYEKNTRKWNTLNHQLEEGKITIRPTIKLMAKVLGLSPRQVQYYLSMARKLGLELSNDSKKTDKQNKPKDLKILLKKNKNTTINL